jgi:hypothetical protein
MTEQHEGPAIHAEVAFEERDTSVAGVLWFGVGLALTTGLACLVMWGVFAFLSAQERRAHKAPFTAQYTPTDVPKTAPLEGLIPGQSAASAARAMTPPDGYGWVDRRSGVVRVPVARAAALLAGRLPAREEKP